MPFRLTRSRVGYVVPALVLSVATLAGLTACTSSSPDPVTSSPVARVTPSAGPAVPFSATAPSDVALAHFDATVQSLLKTDPQPHGDDVVKALAAAGFDKKQMQITPDQTTVDRNVDSIEFSVLWQKKTCLLGQVGSAGYSQSSAPVLSTGKCLIGTTRAIG